MNIYAIKVAKEYILTSSGTFSFGCPRAHPSSPVMEILNSFQIPLSTTTLRVEAQLTPHLGLLFLVGTI